MRLKLMRRRAVCTAEAVLAAGSALASVLQDASPDARKKYIAACENIVQRHAQAVKTFEVIDYSRPTQPWPVSVAP